MDKPKHIVSDDVLAEQLKQGDIQALGHIYRKYSSSLYNTVYNLLRNDQLSEDLVHDLFVDLWQRREHHHIVQLKPYLYLAARNRVLMLLRSNRITIDFSSLELAVNETPEDIVAVKEINALLNREIETLPEKCREIYTLSRIEQRSHKEIASLKNISVKTVENQISIALKRLRPALKNFLTLFLLFVFSNQ